MPKNQIINPPSRSASADEKVWFNSPGLALGFNTIYSFFCEILCLSAFVAILFFATTLALKLQRRRKSTKTLRFTKVYA